MLKALRRLQCTFPCIRGTGCPRAPPYIQLALCPRPYKQGPPVLHLMNSATPCPKPYVQCAPCPTPYIQRALCPRPFEQYAPPPVPRPYEQVAPYSRPYTSERMVQCPP
ncbi:hypothetical protein M8J75_016583 [Diaphorina citri]|nr:hypothetical protein M8J75_016583 [Diaphorina citri]